MSAFCNAGGLQLVVPNYMLYDERPRKNKLKPTEEIEQQFFNQTVFQLFQLYKPLGGAELTTYLDILANNMPQVLIGVEEQKKNDNYFTVLTSLEEAYKKLDLNSVLYNIDERLYNFFKETYVYIAKYEYSVPNLEFFLKKIVATIFVEIGKI